MSKNSNKKSNKAKGGRNKKKNPTNGPPFPAVSRLPSRYPAAVGDEAVVRIHTASILAAPGAAPFIKTGLIILGRGTSSTGYEFLSSLSTLFNSLSLVYTKFMISEIRVSVRATGVGGNANTFLAISYIPSNSTTDSPPTGLNEVSQSTHYCESSLGTVGEVRVQPCMYYNDWRDCNDLDDGDKQAGVLQYYGSGSDANVTIGIIDITATVHFCGLRG